jgi:dihydroorotate dehydrogenase electron transfer subunit
MSSKYLKAKISSNEKIADGIYKMVVSGNYEAVPGQFYMLRAWGIEPFLSRPISIHGIGSDGIEFLYEVRGRGTEIFSKLGSGDEIELLGPVGNGFDLEKISGKVAVVVGGIGIAPMYEVMKHIENSEVDLYAGFRDEVYSVEYMKEFADNTIISTESGRVGHKGYVVEMLDASKYDYILSCGPTPMMKVVKELGEKANTPVYLSLESHMACGIGACLGCTCKTKYGRERVCKEGPVFLGEDVFLDD